MVVAVLWVLPWLPLLLSVTGMARRRNVVCRESPQRSCVKKRTPARELKVEVGKAGKTEEKTKSSRQRAIEICR